MNKNYLLKKPATMAFLCFVSFFLGALALQAQTIRYVKQGGTGTGTSWATASGNLQNMINASSANDEVWVAAGTYLPTTLAGDGTTDRHKAILLKNEVKVYGGFPATGSPVWTDRNWQSNETILSGDLGATGVTTDNAYHVLLAVGTESNPFNENTILDGFTVKDGNANATGMAWIVMNGFTVATNKGGAILMIYGNMTLKNNLFINNNATSRGGAIYFSNSSVTLSYSSVKQNTCQYGAGIASESLGVLNLDHVTVSGNSAMYRGGGIHIDYSQLNAVNCAITGNAAFTIVGAGTDGGGLYIGGESNVTLTNVTVSGNKCNGYGGGIYSSSSNLNLQNCIVYGNSNSGLYSNGFNTFVLTISNSLVQEYIDTNVGVIAGGPDPLFTNAPLPVTAPFIGGDYTVNSSCSPIINAGNNSFLPAGTITDLAGNSRLYAGGVVDIGASEYQDEAFNAPPTAPLNQTLDGGATVADLVATGQNLKWYLTATGGTQLAVTDLLVQGTTYYVSQTIDGCESTRVPVQITLTYYYTRYVKAGATGSGQSWADASGDLQAMINSPYVQQVWVAAGTYMPTVILTNGTSDRDKVFQLKDGVKVYGGFPATGNPVLSDRDWEANPTILSGDLGTIGSNLDNAYHVVLAYAKESQPLTEETILDGFTITNGYGIDAVDDNQVIIDSQIISRNSGAGLYITNYTYAQFANLSINNNSSDFGSGITINNYSFPVFNNLTVNNNVANTNGGGLAIFGAPVFNNLSVHDNQSQYSGGGIFFSSYFYDEIATFNNAHIFNNTSAGNGGGILSESGAIVFNNSRINGNIAGGDGGGMHTLNGAVTVHNTFITGNTATGQGGGMFNVAGYLNLTNVTIAGNNLTMGSSGVPFAGGMCNNSCELTLTNSVIYGNRGNVVNFVTTFDYFNSLVQGANGMANGNLSGSIDPLFADAPLYDTAPFIIGNYNLQPNSPLINAGSNTLYTNAGGNTETDLDVDGNPRIYDLENGGTIDIGAFEYQGAPNCAYTTIWNGTAWSNGEPQTNDYSAIITGNYTSTGDITACSLYIYDGDVTVQAGDTFTVNGGVTVDNANATFTIQNNGALVQVNDAANNGTILFNKQANALFNNQYTLWSSPVAGQNLNNFSPLTQNGAFYQYSTVNGNSGYNAVDPVTNNFLPAKGYRIGMPQSITGPEAAAYTAGTYAYNYNGIFTGVPQNGAINATLNTTGDLYSAIGNPYPSPVSIFDFFEAGDGILDPASPIYLWNQSNNATGYAMVTSTTYVSNDPNTNSEPAYSGDPINWTIAPAQGFLVQTTGQDAVFTFTNSMRRGANLNQSFFKTADSFPLSRLWLNLTGPGNAFQQISVAYKDGATLGIDAGMEGKLLAAPASLELYSLVQDTHLAIQTRPAFNVNDVVALGYKSIAAGQYTIAIDHFDGTFEDGQDIYIKDLAQGGLLTNLTEGNYTFTTDAGTFNSRFEIVYTAPLGVDGVSFNNNVIVYKNNNGLTIDAQQATINSVTLYDVSGRSVYSRQNINESKTIITTLLEKDQVLFTEITTNMGRVTKKVMY